MPKKENHTKTEGILEIVAAFLVLFSALIEPKMAFALAVILLIVFGLLKMFNK